MSGAPVETPAVEVITFGCRLNTNESDVIRRNAEAAGLNAAVIINTCAVTAEAERQALTVMFETVAAYTPDQA